MAQKLKIGKSVVEMRSNETGKCIFFGEKRCISAPNKNVIEEQKKLSKSTSAKAKKDRCNGKNISCKYFVGESIFCPIYDEQYILPEKEAQILTLALQEADNILIFGPPGTGKTSIIKQLAAILNWGIEQYDCSEETSSSKILGQWIIAGDQMEWIDGHITHAMKHGLILLEDEVDFMRPELRGEIHGVMEKGGTISMISSHPQTGKLFRETIHKHPNFRWISTANTIGHGDDSFIFHGTQYMNAASRDRYEILLSVGFKPEDQELAILQSRTEIEKETAKRMIGIANECRNSAKEETSDMMFQFTLRRLLAWAKYWDKLGPLLSSELAVLNYCNDSDRHTVKSLMRTNLGLEELQ